MEPEIVYTRSAGSEWLTDAVEGLEARAHALKLGRDWRVEGVAVGGCIDAIGTGRMGAFRRQGHAHTNATDPHRGWVCILSRRPERLLTPTGRPTRLLIHEVAHIVTMSGHDAFWRRVVGALGAPSEVRPYARRTR